MSALASLVDSQWGDQLMSQKAMSSYTVISFSKGSPGELNRISGVFDWRFTAATNSRGTLTRKVVCASVRFTATLSEKDLKIEEKSRKIDANHLKSPERHQKTTPSRRRLQGLRIQDAEVVFRGGHRQ